MRKFLRRIRFFPISWFFIPRGYHCYKNKRSKPCLYWDSIKKLQEQEKGYCYYLKCGDKDINNDEKRIFINTKTGEKIKAPDMSIGVGLLWDQCKECGIKPYREKINYFIKLKKIIWRNGK
jgi:hypothetical protein